MSVIPSTTIGGGGLNSLKNVSYSFIHIYLSSLQGFPCGSAGKESACNVGDLGSIPGFRRSLGEGKGCPLHYSGLENSIIYNSWGRKVLDTTERLSQAASRAVFSYEP